jgi:hypothetical protein
LDWFLQIGLKRVSRSVWDSHTNFISFPQKEIVVTHFNEYFVPCFCVFKTIESVGNYRSWFQSNFYVHRLREGKKPKSHYVMLHPYQLDALHNTNCRVIKRWTDKVKLYNKINKDTDTKNIRKKKICDFWTKKDFESGAFLWVGRVRANKHILFYGLIINFANINKTKDPLSPYLIEHKKAYDIWLWTSMSWFWDRHKRGMVKLVNGIPNLIHYIYMCFFSGRNANK